MQLFWVFYVLRNLLFEKNTRKTCSMSTKDKMIRLQGEFQDDRHTKNQRKMPIKDLKQYFWQFLNRNLNDKIEFLHTTSFVCIKSVTSV
jgi:hypothetical protein